MSQHNSSRAASPTIGHSRANSPAFQQPSDEKDDEKHPTANEDGVEYPQGLTLALITIALCLSVFLVALSKTATAIPKITDQFQSLDDVGWPSFSRPFRATHNLARYLLTTSAFQLLFGRFYSFLSIKWLGSLICGVAPNSTALIVGRAIAGLGSAGIFQARALIIVANTVPLANRPMYTGMIGPCMGQIASVAGPLMGGVFTDKVSWRWCNLPIGAVTFARRTKQTMTLTERINQFDPFGTVIFVPAIVCLLLALQWGGSKYPWKDGHMATVPPRIAKNRSIATGMWYALCLGSSFFILVYFLPIWFQAIKGVSAVKQTLGGALFVSVAQNVFTNKLKDGLASHVPGLNPAIVLNAGATSLRNAVDPQYLPAVISAYNDALVSAFYVSVAMACLSLVGALAIEWKSVKGKNIEMAMG
ncbi:hypothetical protein B0H12DRAFT_1148950 [Mycena haematopus]|nr:hypothetical protein B0H12DRAFT_1148950 [Mycena haematopus]